MSQLTECFAQRTIAVTGGKPILTTEVPSPALWQQLADRLPARLARSALIWAQDIADQLIAEPGWNGPVRYLHLSDTKGAPIGIVPLAHVRRSGIRLLALAGPFVPGRVFPVVPEHAGAAASAIVAALKDLPSTRALRLGPVCGEDATYLALRESLQKSGWRVLELKQAYRPMVDLPDTAEAYTKSLSRNLLKSMRRRRRALEREYASIELRKFTNNDATDWDEVLSHLATITNASWLTEEDGDLYFESAHRRTFWKKVLATRSRHLSPVVWILYLDEKPAAFQVALDYGNTRDLVSSHYSNEFRNYALGHIIYLEAFEDAIRAGINVVDFGGGDGGHKKQWGVSRYHIDLDELAFRPGLAGAILYKAAKWRLQRRARNTGAPPG